MVYAKYLCIYAQSGKNFCSELIGLKNGINNLFFSHNIMSETAEYCTVPQVSCFQDPE